MGKPRDNKSKIVDRIKSGNHSLNPGKKSSPKSISFFFQV